MIRQLLPIVLGSILLLCGGISLGWADAPDVLGDETVSFSISPTNTSEQAPWSQFQEISALNAVRPVDPAMQPKGIPVDTFRFYPSLTTSISFDDNVFRVPSTRRGDFFFSEDPTAYLDLLRENGDFRIYADGDLDQYLTYDTVNSSQYDVGLGGEYLLTHDLWMSGRASFSRLVEPLSSPNVVLRQDGPTPYFQTQVSTQVVYEPSRLAFSIGANGSWYAYDTTPLFAGPSVSNSDRNQGIYSTFGRASYHFAPGYAVFVRVSGNSDDYQQHFDRNGIDRSSAGYEADVGTNVLLGSLLSGEIYAGFVRQLYNQNQPTPLSDIEGPDFGAQLDWFATELLIVHFRALRQIENTVVNGASGGDDIIGTVDAEYELTRFIGLTAAASYGDTNYPGSLPHLEDRDATLTLGINYHVSHYWGLLFGYEFSSRSSTLHNYDYDDNLVRFGISVQV